MPRKDPTKKATHEFSSISEFDRAIRQLAKVSKQEIQRREKADKRRKA